MLKNSLLLLGLFVSMIDAFSLKMMSSSRDTYLQSLGIKSANQLRSCIPAITKIQSTFNETDQENVHIDTIVLNIHRVDNVFFNRNSKTIMLKMKDEMKDIYLYEKDEDLKKLSNSTKIVSQSFKNFFVYPMQIDVDAVIYKE